MSLNTGQYGISVIMPVHNGGEYLLDAVKSVLAQEEVLFELVIIDDYSTDNAIIDVQKSLENETTSIDNIIIKHSPARGIVPALNYGISNARYNYIARMDGDDIAHPRRLISQLQYQIENPDIHIIGAQVEMFCEQGDLGHGYALYESWINKLQNHQQIAQNFFIESPIPHPTAFFHKSVINKLGGYEDTPWPEDYDLWCRAFLAGFKFGKPTTHLLLKWRDLENRLSRTDQRYSKQHFLQCKAKYLSLHLKQHGYESATIWGTGPTGLKMHDYLIEQEFTITNFIDVNQKFEGRTKRDKPINVIITVSDLVSYHAKNSSSKHIILIAVSARGAREEIRAFMSKANLTEHFSNDFNSDHSDFLMIA